MNGAEQKIEALAELFRRRGAKAYLGEPVTVAEHMLQCAALADAEGAPDALVSAALLHDIGHLTGAAGEYRPDDVKDRRHEEAGAAILKGFPPAVVDSVRLHVAAKRYLCTIDDGYHDRLSPASRHSLVLQGGPMNASERAMFEAEPFHREAMQVRRWDDAGKAAGLLTPGFDFYRSLLGRMVDS